MNDIMRVVGCFLAELLSFVLQLISANRSDLTHPVFGQTFQEGSLLMCERNLQ